MKKLYALFLFALALLVIACGGGGGGGGGGGSSSGGGFVITRIEAAVASNPGRSVDPRHILHGESIVFQLVGYTAGGGRTVISVSTFATNDNAAQSGPVQPTGEFTATGVSAQAYIVSATHSGVTYQRQYRVVTLKAVVTGSVIDTNNRGVDAADVVFYNAAGDVVERVRTEFDGFFRGSIPTNAVKFNIDPATLSNVKYYKSFRYDSLRYTMLDPDLCSPSLPALSNGVTTNLTAARVDARLGPTGGLNTPPPPPDGC